MAALRDSPDEGVLVDEAWLSALVDRVAALEKLVGTSPASPSLQQLGVTVTPAPPKPPDPPLLVPHEVTGSTTLSTDHYEYDVKPVVGGDSSHHGLFAFGTTIKARNTSENESRGGYTSAGGIRAIANGKIVYCWWSFRNDAGVVKPQLLFTMDNEPTCST